MMFAIPIGYFIAIFMFVSGLYGAVDFLQHKPADCANALVFKKLIEAAWPMAVSAIILLLIQMNRQLEDLRLNASYSPDERTAPKKKKLKKVVREEEEEEPAPVAARAAAPVSMPATAPQIHTPASIMPATRATPAASSTPPMKPVVPMPNIAPHPAAAVPHPAPASVPISAGKTPLYPNSPIPGGGRVPQAPPPQADGIDKLPSGGKRAPRKDEHQELSFFKVD